ncbi:unnamed protein product [Agarophyton chilense]
MSPLRLRFRFPDGRQLTLTDVSPTDTYHALLSRVQKELGLTEDPERVLIAGPPPRPVEADANATVNTLFKSGDALLVEPPKPRRSRRRTTTQRQPPSKNGKNDTRAAKSSVQGLRDLTSEVLVIDSGDEWTPDIEDLEEVRPVRPTPNRRGGKKRGRVAPSAVSSGVTGNVATSKDSKRQKTKKDSGDMMEALMGGDARGLLGAELAKAVSKDASELDACGKSFRNSLQTALSERQKEAEGERRYEAWLSKRYEIIDNGGYTFKVRYRALNARAWTEEQGMFKVPREILAEAFRDVVKNQEERERLRALSMAIVSPRSFWNMVRLFGDRIEEGLAELLPESDWSFISTRPRTLSTKARRNLEQATDVDVVHID